MLQGKVPVYARRDDGMTWISSQALAEPSKPEGHQEASSGISSRTVSPLPLFLLARASEAPMREAARGSPWQALLRLSSEAVGLRLVER